MNIRFSNLLDLTALGDVLSRVKQTSCGRNCDVCFWHKADIASHAAVAAAC
jgi:hypothetical protein